MSEQETWPSWRYGPDGEAAIFASAEEVPGGWSDRQFTSDEGAGDTWGDRLNRNVLELPEGLKDWKPSADSNAIETTDSGTVETFEPVAVHASVFDHDGDGEPGGSANPEPSDELANLRKEYKKVFKKKAFNGWDADTLRAKIAAKA